MNKFRLDYDTAFGMDGAAGWSVAIDGEYVVSLERWLVVALIKAWLRVRGRREE